MGLDKQYRQLELIFGEPDVTKLTYDELMYVAKHNVNWFINAKVAVIQQKWKDS